MGPLLPTAGEEKPEEATLFSRGCSTEEARLALPGGAKMTESASAFMREPAAIPQAGKVSAAFAVRLL